MLFQTIISLSLDCSKNGAEELDRGVKKTQLEKKV